MCAKLNEALTYRGQPLSAWVRLLEHADEAERRRAVTGLAEIGAALAAVLPALSGALKDASAATRAQVATALGELGAEAMWLLPGVRASLRSHVLTDRDESVRTAALQALVQLGPEARTQVPALIDTLKDQLPYVRLSAAHALSQLGAEAKPAIPALTGVALHDTDSRVRLEAAVAIWHIDKRPGRVVPVLIEALRDADEVHRWIAADCLGEIGPDAAEAVTALQDALRTQYNSRLIHMSIALALERIDPRAAPPLGL